MIHIELKDFLLRILTLQLKRQKHFLNLALQRAILRQIGIFSKLLRNRRAALRDGTPANIRPNRTHDAAWIDARMVVEAIILNRDKRILEILRNIVDAHRHTIFCRMYISDLVAVDIINLRRSGRHNIFR